MNLYPGILTDSVEEVVHHLGVLSEHPSLSTVHIDIMDGYFVDEVSVAPLDIAGLEFGELMIDLHLMVDEPMDFLFEAQALKDQLPVRAVLGQLEHMSFQRSFLEEVKVNGWKAGLSLGLETPISAIDENAWEHLDVVQLMAVEMGRSGQDFHAEVWPKIAELQRTAKLFGRHEALELIVDGGVSLQTLNRLNTAGVNSVVVTSDIWQTADPDQALTELLAAV